MKKRKQTRKIPYQAPALRTIELAAEEVIAVGCKMVSSGGGNKPGNCIVPDLFHTVDPNGLKYQKYPAPDEIIN